MKVHVQLLKTFKNPMDSYPSYLNDGHLGKEKQSISPCYYYTTSSYLN